MAGHNHLQNSFSGHSVSLDTSRKAVPKLPGARNPSVDLDSSLTRIVVPGSKRHSLSAALRSTGRFRIPELNSNTRVAFLPSFDRLVMTWTSSPSMKVEKKPMPYFPIDRNPVLSSPGYSLRINVEPQYGWPKSRNGPVSSSSDIPTPESETTSHSASLCSSIRTKILPQFSARSSKTRRATTASLAF